MTDSSSHTAQMAHQVYLKVQQLAAQQQQQGAELLRTQQLSLPQYNVLRILRGAGEEGQTCSGISNRLVVNDPDVTRLLDRLEKAGLIRRERHPKDRRVVLSFITPQGLELLDALDEPTSELHRQQFTGLTPEQLDQLSALLALLP